MTNNNVYQHRVPNTLTRFSTLYATFPRHRHHPRLNTEHSNHTLKSRSSRRFSSLWEVQLELGEIPGMLSPNILEPYQPIDIDVREDEGEEESQVEEDEEDEEEEQRVEGEEEMEGEEEEEQEEEGDGDGDEPFGDFYLPDGIYSYTTPLHPSDSTSSLLLPGPLPWATIVDTPEEMEDETTPYPSSSSSTLSTSSSSSLSSSAEIILVKYETRETILEDEAGEDEVDTDELEPSPVTGPARIATALGIHPLDGPYATHSVPALEEDDHHQDDDAKDQEQTQVLSFSNAPTSASSIAKSTRPAPTLLLSSVHSEMRQDRKDSGVFIMHDDGFIKMETENGPLLPPPRPAPVLANREVMPLFYSSPESSETVSVMDQGDAAPPLPPPSRLHMYSSLMTGSSLISLSA
ncbi:hypothetical protein BG006_006930 [Podila minutissima]|uniref:Uncharacterized protein n=1 Tax=Podila minutissima TaxID=64525 RepID=A0A9P5SLV4_9FUNG|nr:hypothetical protein BG006_006930 [Podila minutissima]